MRGTKGGQNQPDHGSQNNRNAMAHCTPRARRPDMSAPDVPKPEDKPTHRSPMIW
jgi:hypothetical protein